MLPGKELDVVSLAKTFYKDNLEQHVNKLSNMDVDVSKWTDEVKKLWQPKTTVCGYDL